MTTTAARESAVAAAKEAPGARRRPSRTRRLPELLTWDNAPEYLRHNDFILTGYRGGWTFKSLAWSMFDLHNESLNIWTHLIGFLCFATLTWWMGSSIPEVHEGGGITVRWPFFVFMVGAMVCLAASTFCHLFGCCLSKELCNFIWRFDYVGIAFLIATSFFPIVYYGFLCHPKWQIFYLLSISLIGVGVVSISVMDKFQTKRFLPMRAALFSGMGLSGVVPTFHQFFVNYDEPHAGWLILYELAMGACYLLGAVLYATRTPERFFPGKLDIIGHSHQIFHICVVLGALVHYNAAHILLEWRDSSGGHNVCKVE